MRDSDRFGKAGSTSNGLSDPVATDDSGIAGLGFEDGWVVGGLCVDVTVGIGVGLAVVAEMDSRTLPHAMSTRSRTAKVNDVVMNRLYPPT